VEHTAESGKVIFTFGDFPQQAEGRVFVLSNPDFEQQDQPIDVSEVYIDTTTCDKRLLERFMAFIAHYSPKRGLRSVQIFYRGELEDLGENLKNALQNTFKFVEKADW
jgi:hypothetical protein